MNDQLQDALRMFVPEFGNEEDIDIVKSLNKITKKLESIDSEKFRELEKKKNMNLLTAKMKEIQREEASVLRRINKRNLDF